MHPTRRTQEPPSLAIRALFMLRIGELAASTGLTQAEAAARLGLTQPRLNALLKGRVEQFSLDALMNVAARAGLHVQLALADTPVREAPSPGWTAPDQAAPRRAGLTHAASTNALTAAELAAIPLFASLSRTALRQAKRLFTVRAYPKGAVVVNEGERLDLFNFILSGHVQPFWRDDAGHQLNLGVDGPGNHFVDAALGGEPVLASFVAITDLRVASIRMTDMRGLLQRHPEIAVVLLMDVVARFRRFLRRAKTLTMENVYGRVVAFLLARAKQTGGKLVADRLTHVEIGHRVGATREMVGRLLRDLARGGYIEVERGRVTILRKPPRRW
jgi:CRP/FNR family transcriptional regulator, cyclic AMP receptor protein